MSEGYGQDELLDDPPEIATALGDLTLSEQTAHRLATLAATRQRDYDNILQTKTFRYASLVRRAYRNLRRLRNIRSLPGAVRALRRPGPEAGDIEAPIPTPVPDVTQTYPLWTDLFDAVDEKRFESRLATLTTRPLVSLILCATGNSVDDLKGTVEAIQNQIYPRWELVIATRSDSGPALDKQLARYAKRDGRVSISTGLAGMGDGGTFDLHAVASRLKGDWVALLEDDGSLATHALAMAVLTAAQQPGAKVLYSDEDGIDSRGRRHSPDFKPDYDPLLSLSQNYMRHLLLVRHDVWEAVTQGCDRLRMNFEWDLALRATGITEAQDVVHVPHVLYHSYSGSSQSPGSLRAHDGSEAGGGVVVDHLQRLGREATVVRGASSRDNRITWKLPEHPPRVSILIPTRDGSALSQCISSVLETTTYPNFEVVVIDNGSIQRETLELLRALRDKISVIRDERPFNYSALNNAAAEQTTGEVICLLNDDTEIVVPHWLDEMVGQLLQPRVGAVGAKLLYDDGRIQHAGIVLGMGGVAGHPGRRTDGSSPGFAGRLDVARTVSAVTGACMVVRRTAWEEVGGLEEEHLAVAFNDVDLCLRLGEAGWRVVCTPFAELVHHESISRGSEDHRLKEFGAENDYMRARWGLKLRTDPAYNPNLSLATEDGSLAWPPRIPGGRL
jgi:O-antigen biosynthesis protein